MEDNNSIKNRLPINFFWLAQDYFARESRLGLAMTGLALIAIAALTLYPYDFFLIETWTDFSWVDFVQQSLFDHLVASEFVANVLLFLPLGFGLSQLTLGAYSSTLKQALWKAIVISFATTLTIECLQIFLPTRHSSCSDLIANTVGGGLGYIVGWQLSGVISQGKVALGRYFQRLKVQTFSRRLFAVILGGYCFWALSGTANLSDRTTLWSLNNWDLTYPLLLGNETTGDRPWVGHIDRIQFYAQNLDPAAVETLLAQPDAILGNSALIAHYYLQGAAPYRNISSHVDEFSDRLPDLIWQNDQTETGLPIISPWLQTETPPTILTQQIQSAQAFTLNLSFTADNNRQTGPARILSLSKDPYHRNLTIGQVGKHLSLRLRTPMTKANGHRPEFIIPNVFTAVPTSHHSHHLVLTYNHQSITAYLDTIAHRYSFQLSPEATLFWLMSPPFSSTTHLSSAVSQFYKYLYRSLFSIVLGMLLALSVPTQLNRHQCLIFLGVGIVIPCVLLEIFLRSSLSFWETCGWIVSAGVAGLTVHLMRWAYVSAIPNSKSSHSKIPQI